MARKRREWGRVRQLPSGRWQARYPGPDGRLRPAPETFKTRADAASWLADKQSEIGRADWIDPDAGRVPFEEYAAAWITERRLSETTRERYEGILRNHLAPSLGSVAVADISPAVVRRWYHERREHVREQGTGEPTIAKSYRLLHAVMHTAVDDEIIRRNPCRIVGASQDRPEERSILTVDQVYVVADATGDRFRMLVLLAAFTSLRFGELAALCRRDVDLQAGEVYVRHNQAEPRGGLVMKEPKSDAGVRLVAIPPPLCPDLAAHMEAFGESGDDGRVFVGPLGGRLRRRNFRRLWNRALKDAGLGGRGFHFHDLRHTGNQLAAVAGATTKELMARMGHSSVRAALIYQHSTRERDRAIAKVMGQGIPGRADEESGAREGHEATEGGDGVPDTASA